MTITLTLFTASWCQPCKAFKPKLAAMAQDMGVDVIVQDIEHAPQEVKSVPTVMVRLPDMGGYPTFFTGTNLEPIRTTLKEYVD